MKVLASDRPGSAVESRRYLGRRYVVLGIAGLSAVAAVALVFPVMGLPLSWTADYDRARYGRIVEAIAAEPQHLCGQRLYDVSRELALEDVPWDDGNLQNLPGSFRIYHFRGFALYLSLDYMRQGVTQDMLLARGGSLGQLPARDSLRIDRFQPPYVRIDGISNGEERMRKYRAWAEESVGEHNKRTELERRRRLDRQD